MKGNRAYRTATQMYPLIEKWYNSGQSRSAYCKANNIALHLFAYWHKSYQEHKNTSLKEESSFINLNISAEPELEMSIHYPNGNRLLLGSVTNITLIERLVKINCHV